MMLLTRISRPLFSRITSASCQACFIHSTSSYRAHVVPLVGTGPPPDPPTPAARAANERILRRKKHSELLKAAKSVKSSKTGKSSNVRSRFWRHVSVKQIDDALQIFLDSRPLKHPRTKKIIKVPLSKPSLAAALALEWDLLTSAQQATKNHLVPLTGLICRALDIEEDDGSSAPDMGKIRTDIVTLVMRYLDTDTLLCWAPPPGQYDIRNDAGEGLRDVQKRVAEDIISFLAVHVWPGITIEPVLDGHSIFPRPQADGVRERVKSWVEQLSPWDLAGLERAVLAGKSLVAAARLVAEWSEGPAGRRVPIPAQRFGVEEAARALTTEVDWQASQWGEVEDTHDVDKEDIRRQLGSVFLVVSGSGKSF